MKNKRAICIMWILSLLPAALVMACASRLPAQVPIHWNLDGTVDYAPAWNLWLSRRPLPGSGSAVPVSSPH